MNISTAIDIKKEKLARELGRKRPDKHIVRRLRESIRRHTQEARWESRRRKILKGGRY